MLREMIDEWHRMVWRLIVRLDLEKPLERIVVWLERRLR